MDALHLASMTLSSIFRKPETTCYPSEIRPLPLGHRGQVICSSDACIFCGMCAKACPARCLTVDRKAAIWSINRLSCVQCGNCVHNCPKECLSMEAVNPTIETAGQAC